MARFRKNKFFKKKNSQTQPEIFNNTEKQELETAVVQERTSNNNTSTGKSWIKSGTKYVYIIAIAALASGIFTPFTTGAELETVISGILILLVGVGGGILIFIGYQRESHSKILVLVGLSFIIISLFLMFVIAKGIII